MDITKQLEILDEMDKPESFADKLKQFSLFPMRATSVEILQMNITRKCNLCCRHCHVESSPERGEEMSKEDMVFCLKAVSHPKVTTIDVTGGSPEMHPHLEWFLKEASTLKKRILVRSNIVILMDEKYRHFIDVFCETGVEVVASLPNLHREKTDRMRGANTFDFIIDGLKLLNSKGYGMPGSDLILNLVYNPTGAFLPASQQAIAHEYKNKLHQDFGIEFHQVYCLTNCPVGRYLDFLKKSGNLFQYFTLLKQQFNSNAMNQVMCKTTLSIAWNGKLYDCDFNQMLDLPLNDGTPVHIRDFDFEKLANREIVIRSHCFACTAGAGSSCQGALDS